MKDENQLFEEEIRKAVAPRNAGVSHLAITTTNTGAADDNTRVQTNGHGKYLFIPDLDPLDDSSYYLGDSPVI